MSLLERFQNGDIRALSRIISHVENETDGYRDLLGRLYRRNGQSIRIGITGPPGAGKSTLVNGLARTYLDSGHKVGVVAVDPTSPFTGGALLGDRVRMSDFPMDGRFFFRSMATRGATGGLALATDNVTLIYDAFGFDITLIETVGVGQVELDIINACDSVVVVVVPESGDAVQTMKAGLMEIADIFVVNKADRPGSERIVSELRQMLRVRKPVEHAWPIQVLGTEATRSKGIPELRDQLDRHLEHIKGNGEFEKRRRRQIRRKITRILQTEVSMLIEKRLPKSTDLEQLINDIYAGKSDPFTASEEILRLSVNHLADA